jgi:hypothetical protein
MSPFALTLLQPLGLLAIPAAVAGLVYAYRRRGIGTRAIVASVLILKRIERRIVPRRTFKPPFRFFAELLLLAVLSVGLAGLAFREGGERVVLVLDTSLSMGSTERGPEDTWTRARKVAEEELNGLSLIDTVEVWQTSPQLKRVGRNKLTPGEAVSLVRELQIQFGGDGLDAGLGRLLSDASDARIVIITDRRTLGSFDKDSRIQVRSLGTDQPRGNLALAGIAVRGEGVDLTVRSYTSRQTVAQLRLESWRSERWNLLDERSISIEAGANLVESFPLRSPDEKAYRATLSLRDAQGSDDQLLFDNQAWIAPKSARTVIDVVSPLSLAELGVEKLGAFEFRTLAKIEDAKGRFLIVHRGAPYRGEGEGILEVRPRGGTQSAIRDATVSRWSARHPILTYVAVPVLRFPEVEPLPIDPAFMTIMASSAGPLLTAAESANRRQARVAFELFPFEGRGDPAVSILTLNLLRWITGTGLSTGYVGVGEPLPVQADGSVTMLDLPTPLTPVDPSSAVAVVPGLYESAGSQIAVNFFSAEESDLRNIPPLEVPERVAAVTTNNNGAPLYRVVVSLVAVLLLFLLLGFSFFRRPVPEANAGGSV